ncbi:dihydrolipoamide acetyltransferase family protein [Nanoarchaeota archaeon]
MAEFKFPDVAEGITEGKLISWKVKEGDNVVNDQILCEMETDKAVLEIPSPEKGIVTKLHFKPGDTVPVGQVLITFDGTKSADEAKPEQETKQPEADIKKPTPSKTKAQQGKALPKDRKLAKELGVDLATITGTGSQGRVTADDIKAAAGSAPVKPAEATPVETKPAKPAEQAPAEPTQRAQRRIRAPPSVRKRARELGVEVEKLTKTPEAPVPAAPPLPVSGERIKIKGVRAIIKKRMEESWDNIPHAAVQIEFNAEKLVAHRQAAKQRLADKGIKLTYLAYVVRVLADALENFPKFNASIDEKTQEIILKHDINIGIAVDTPDGLFVPNIKEANKKSIAQIAKEIQELAQKARDRKLSLEEMAGGTFTITNIGSFGATSGTTIINYPEVAILMVGRMHDNMFPLNLTFDHRIQDGADAGRFLNFMIELLQDPQMEVEW